MYIPGPTPCTRWSLNLNPWRCGGLRCVDNPRLSRANSAVLLSFSPAFVVLGLNIWVYTNIYFMPATLPVSSFFSFPEFSFVFSILASNSSPQILSFKPFVLYQNGCLGTCAASLAEVLVVTAWHAGMKPKPGLPAVRKCSFFSRSWSSVARR